MSVAPPAGTHALLRQRLPRGLPALGVAAVLGVLHAAPARGGELCEGDGKRVRPEGRGGVTGLVRCKDLDTGERTSEAPYVNGRIHGTEQRWIYDHKTVETE